jgi:hypothetical protein
MLNTNNTNGQKCENQEQLSISNRSTHDKQYPFLKEFNQLIAQVSIDDLENNLLTHTQKNFAKAIWEAENYGGSRTKCEKRLKELHGPKWYLVTSIDEHMADIREYYEYVLQIDHRQQWNKYKNSAKLQITSDLE